MQWEMQNVLPLATAFGCDFFLHVASATLECTLTVTIDIAQMIIKLFSCIKGTLRYFCRNTLPVVMRY